jgi:hypothetical protein
MPPDPHPSSVEQFEHDLNGFGPATAKHQHRLLCELSWHSLKEAREHIARSREILALTAPSPSRGSVVVPRGLGTRLSGAAADLRALELPAGGRARASQ